MKKPKKIYLTDHSKVGFDERTDYSNTEYAALATQAFKNGYEFSDFKEPLSDFLKSISYDSGKYVAKIYQDHIYIFNNFHGHRLLTVYSVPDEYLPVEQHLIPKEELERCAIILTNKTTGAVYYWHEFGGLTQDLDEILEFRNQKTAQNYINNNKDLELYKDSYEIDLF